MTGVTTEGGEGAGGGAGGRGGGRRGDEFDRLGVGGDLSGPAITQRHEQAQALVQDLREFGEVLTDPHVMLDVAGAFPGIGRAADAFNASLYAVKGNWAAAALHAAGAVPVVGESRRAARVAGIGPAGTRQVQRAVDAAPSAATLTRSQKALIAEERAARTMTRAGYTRLESRFNGNHGFDSVWIKGPADKPTSIVIVESKFAKDGKLRLGRYNGKEQMSDRWINDVLKRMDKRGGEIARTASIIDRNRANIVKKVNVCDPSGRNSWRTLR